MHAPGDDRRLEQVAAVLGEDLPRLGSPTWWPARPMRCSPRHRARRLDLDDEVDRAHVDAELEAAGGDEAAQVAALELVLDDDAAARGRASRGGP